VCSRFARFLFLSAPTKPTPHQSLAPDDEIVYAMGVTDDGSGLKKAKAWPPVNGQERELLHLHACAGSSSMRAGAR